MSEIAKHWIDGEWVGSGTVSESINPATGAVLGRWADGGEAEARAATSAACAAPLAIADFQEAKTVVHSIPALQD